jgi:transcriptional regulator with XRE-family HTH domain
MSTFGSRLKLAREAKDLSLGDLSKRTGISKGTLSQSEHNDTNLTMDNIKKICRALGLSLDYLVFGESKECDDEWIKLSKTELGYELRDTVLRLHKNSSLTKLLSIVGRFDSPQIETTIGLLQVIQQGYLGKKIE